MSFLPTLVVLLALCSIVVRSLKGPQVWFARTELVLFVVGRLIGAFATEAGDACAVVGSALLLMAGALFCFEAFAWLVWLARRSKTAGKP